MRAGATLVRSWRAASVESAWTEAELWWTPAVDAVADALAGEPVDLVAACELLGRQRADAGIYLDEARADVRVLAKLAGFGPAGSTALMDALTLGWVDRTLDGFFTSSCVDPLTELATMPYLMTRLREVYAEAEVEGIAPSVSYAFVIVHVEGRADAIETETQMITLQMAMRSAFDGGETLARVGANSALALVRRREPRLHMALAALKAVLDVAQHELRLGHVRTWIEALPVEAAGVPLLLRELAG
jgi:hypothetical protein